MDNNWAGTCPFQNANIRSSFNINQNAWKTDLYLLVWYCAIGSTCNYKKKKTYKIQII